MTSTATPLPSGAGPTADPSIAIAADGLVRSFGETRAVDGVDLAVERGEIYGFLGPNGAGKSTCVRVLCTLLAPSAGRATVAGFDVATRQKDVRLRIGVALQDAALDPDQDGEELLRLQGRLYGLSRHELDARLRELEPMIDIGGALRHRIKTYSGGMRRRLDLAAALIHNPDVLFLDEPTTGLDPVSRLRVWEEVRRLNDEGMTIFLTTQYLEEADELAHRVGIIDRGRIIAEGTPTELKRSLGAEVIVAKVGEGVERACAELERVDRVDTVERHGDEITLRTEDAAELLGPVAVALDRCGVPVRSLTMRTPTLDDVFLHLTGAHIEVPADEQPS